MIFRSSNRTARIPRRSKTIPLNGSSVYGDGEDAGKWFRCWNCGFICNVDRDGLGDAETISAITYDTHDVVYSTDDYLTARPGTGRPVGGSVDGHNDGIALLQMATKRSGHVVLKVGADSVALTPWDNYYNTNGSGCPLCHTQNWRGDY